MKGSGPKDFCSKGDIFIVGFFFNLELMGMCEKSVLADFKEVIDANLNSPVAFLGCLIKGQVKKKLFKLYMLYAKVEQKCLLRLSFLLN